jgi:hypothetical protein
MEDFLIIGVPVLIAIVAIARTSCPARGRSWPRPITRPRLPAFRMQRTLLPNPSPRN